MKINSVLRNISAILILGSVVFLPSCLNPDWDFDRISDEIVLSPGVAAPIAFGSLELGDMINEVDITNSIEENANGLLYITYAEGLYSFPANEIIEIPNQTFLEFFIESDIALAPQWTGSDVGDTVSFHKDKSGVFVFENDEKIDSINVKTMDLVIDVRSTFKHTGILTITSDNIILDGQPFQDVVQISDASGNFTYSRTIPIDGHTIYLDNSNPDTTFLPLDFDLDLINSGNPVMASESCDISMTFVDPEFYAIFGYIGDYSLISSSGSVTIEIFDTEDFDGSLLFADPRFTMDVSNSYGIPVEIDINNIQSYSDINDVYTDINFNPGIVPIIIGAPDLGQIGDTVNTLLEIGRDESNIQEALETFPNEFFYSVSARTNPDGPGTSNFITDSSNLQVGFEVNLPLWVKAEGFSLEDTIDFDFEKEIGTDAVDIIDYFRMTMDATNYIPIRVNMQLFFADQNYTILDSMFTDDDFLLPPNVNAEDEVESPAIYSKSVEFTKADLEKIQPSKHMMIRASLNTPGNPVADYVKFYSYYTVDFKLKMKADMTINSRDLSD